MPTSPGKESQTRMRARAPVLPESARHVKALRTVYPREEKPS